MKGLKFSDKIIVFVNSLAAFLLLISYVLPYIPPKKFAVLSVLSLGVPFLIILNILFAVYWLLKVKRQILLSLIVLLIGYRYINSLYKFSGSKHVEDPNNISLMNFNVRVFNDYKWSPSETIRGDIANLIESEQPDILALQEYTRGTPLKLAGYHNFNASYTVNTKPGQSIFSKYPIINSGSLEFPETTNNAIFIDIIKHKDTLRVYNIHLQSTGINTDVEALKRESSENLIKRLSTTFKIQQDQSELIKQHQANCPYKVIVLGDFNNTAYSYVYREIKGDLVDTFEEAGNGFGRTYDFKYFPLRIDFILVDKAFAINGFKSYTENLSDHYPIKATVKLH